MGGNLGALTEGQLGATGASGGECAFFAER